MFKFLFFAVTLFFFFLVRPDWIAASNSLRVIDDTILIEAKYRVEPAEPKVIAALQRALDDYYNNKTFVYKCYHVKFALTVDESKYGRGDDNVIKVVKTSESSAASQAYRDYGMYTCNDWGAYDAANGSNLSAECGSFFGGKYNVDCAVKAQWFFDNGYRNSGVVSLGYSSGFYPPGFSGTNSENGTIYVSDEVTSQILAHEIGHNLGFRHSFELDRPEPYPENVNNDLMYPFLDIDATNVPFSNLHELLDNMNLECRWITKLDNCQISGGVQSAVAYNLQEKGLVNFKIESHDLTLRGEGKKEIDEYQNEPVGGVWECADHAFQSGKFKVSGTIESLPTEKFLQAFNLKIKNQTTTQASESMVCHTIPAMTGGMYFENPVNTQYLEWGLSAGSNTAAYLIANSGRSFDAFNVQLGDPDDLTKILNGPLDFDKTNFYPQSDLRLTTDDLVIKDIERFQRAANDPD